MCLAVPMQITARDGNHGTVASGGAERNVMLTLVPDAAPGDWVIVHAGYALELLSEAEAQRTLELLRELGEAGQ